MYGAIIGDITGSRLEFTRNRNPARVELLPEDGFFTDDTAMTIAVASWLLKGGRLETHIRREYFYTAHLSYGARFRRWIWGEEPGNSKGNGCIMRLGALPVMLGNRARENALALEITNTTHRHPESLRAVTALLQACHGQWHSGVLNWQPLSMRQLRRRHKWTELAEPSMRAVLSCVWNANSFEEAIVNACSIGGDADTLAAAAGTIAEQRFGVPSHLRQRVRGYLPHKYLEVIDEVYSRGTKLRNLGDSDHAASDGHDPGDARSAQDHREEPAALRALRR